MIQGFKASKALDGTFVVHDVPIFCECERGDMTFGADWLRAAFAHAKRAEKEGHLPPLHVEHHEAGASPVAAGVYRPTRLAPVTMGGEKRLAFYADLIVTKEEVAEQILARKLPYRSVEICDVTKPVLNSLALLDHEAPYLELPMVFVSDTQTVPNATFGAKWKVDTSRADEAVVCSFKQDNRAVLTFSGGAMDDEDKDDKGKKDEESVHMESDSSESSDSSGASLDVGPIVSAIQDGSISVAGMKEIMAAIEEQGPVDEAPEIEADEELELAPAAVPGSESMRASKLAATEKIAKMQARIDTLEARNRVTDEKEEVRQALERLQGRPLGSDVKERLTKFRQEYGAGAFKTYVDDLADSVPVWDSSADTSNALSFSSNSNSGGAGKVSEAVLKYEQKGPDILEHAMKFSADWKQLQEAGIGRAVTMDEAEYIATNFARKRIAV